MNNKINEILEVINTLPRGGLAIFCGAGISKESGLPLAIPLMENFLDLFKTYKNDKKLILNIDEKNVSNSLKLPFELFIETIIETTNSDFLDIFKEGKPSQVHYFIANLLQHGRVNTVVTTNFDLLIEEAIQEAGLKRNSNYFVSFTEEDFAKTRYKTKSNYVRNLVKIHGSVEQIDSIRTTLSLIAKRELNDNRKKIIEHLFNTGKHSTILILGYSCSDIFDIMPTIESLKNSDKKVILINHQESLKSLKLFRIKDISEINYFHKFKGWEIIGNTNYFINSLYSYKKSYFTNHSSFIWPDRLKSWVNESVQSDHAKFIIAKLLHKITKYERALHYYTKCLSEKEKSLNNNNIARLLNNIAMIHRDKGNQTEALKFHKKSLKLCCNSEFDLIKAENYNNIGLVYYDQGLFAKALKYYNSSLKLKKKLNDKFGEANTLNNMAVIFKYQNKWEMALKVQRKALFIKRKIGNLQGVSTSLNNIGILYKLKNNYSRSLKYHFESLSIKRRIGFKKGEAVSLNNIGNVYMLMGDFNKAMVFQKLALKLHKSNNYKQGIIDVYDSIGEIYTRTLEFKKALRYRKICLQYIRENKILKDELEILNKIKLIENKIQKKAST